MSELQTINKADLLDKIEDCQHRIDSVENTYGSKSLALGLEQGEYLSQLQATLKIESTAWTKAHDAELRKARRDDDDLLVEQILANKPPGYNDWCDASEHVTAEKRHRQNFKSLYCNKELIEKGQRVAQISSIRSALDLISKKPDMAKLRLMSDEDAEEYLWAKVNKEKPHKQLDASPKGGDAVTLTLDEVSEDAFMAAVSEYIPKEYFDAITDKMDAIPDYTEKLFIQGRVRIIASMAVLLKSDKKKLITALAQMAVSQAEAFRLLKPKYHRDAADRLIKATKAMKDKTAKLTADNVVAPEGSITTEEFKLIRSILHPDSNASSARKNKAFAVFIRAFGGE